MSEEAGPYRDEAESPDEDDDYGNVHIVELPKCGEQLGLQLTHYTSPQGV